MLLYMEKSLPDTIIEIGLVMNLGRIYKQINLHLPVTIMNNFGNIINKKNFFGSLLYIYIYIYI